MTETHKVKAEIEVIVPNKAGEKGAENLVKDKERAMTQIEGIKDVRVLGTVSNDS